MYLQNKGDKNMEKILVYEDGQVNEYDVVYNQEYMDIRLEEYRKKFSVLRKGSILTRKTCNKESIKNIIRYFDDVASYGVSIFEDEECFEVNFIGTINPVGYNLLRGINGEFALNNRKIHSILSWSEALEHRTEKDKIFIQLADAPINDFMGLDERKDAVKNISELLEDISLEYLGKKENATLHEVEIAKSGTKFVDKFSIAKVMPKQLKK